MAQTICYNGIHSGSILGIKSSDTNNMRLTQVPCSNQLDSAKIEKKKKKIQKELRRLLRKGKRILKPVEEKVIWPKLKKEISLGMRTRKDKVVYDNEEEEANILLIKEWGRYRQRQSQNEVEVINRVMNCQDRALRKLKEESEELYLKAIELDESILDFKSKGPCETPPKENYDAQDGQYVDNTEYFIQEKLFVPDDNMKQAYMNALKKKKAEEAS